MEDDLDNLDLEDIDTTDINLDEEILDEWIHFLNDQINYLLQIKEWSSMDCILHVNLIFIHKMDHVVRGEDLATVQKISFQGGEIQDIGLF